MSPSVVEIAWSSRSEKKNWRLRCEKEELFTTSNEKLSCQVYSYISPFSPSHVGLCRNEILQVASGCVVCPRGKDSKIPYGKETWGMARKLSPQRWLQRWSIFPGTSFKLHVSNHSCLNSMLQVLPQSSNNIFNSAESNDIVWSANGNVKAKWKNRGKDNSPAQKHPSNWSPAQSASGSQVPRLRIICFLHLLHFVHTSPWLLCTVKTGKVVPRRLLLGRRWRFTEVLLKSEPHGKETTLCWGFILRLRQELAKYLAEKCARKH